MTSFDLPWEVFLWSIRLSLIKMNVLNIQIVVLKFLNKFTMNKQSLIWVIIWSQTFRHWCFLHLEKAHIQENAAFFSKDKKAVSVFIWEVTSFGNFLNEIPDNSILYFFLEWFSRIISEFPRLLFSQFVASSFGSVVLYYNCFYNSGYLFYDWLHVQIYH